MLAYTNVLSEIELELLAIGCGYFSQHVKLELETNVDVGTQVGLLQKRRQRGRSMFKIVLSFVSKVLVARIADI